MIYATTTSETWLAELAPFLADGRRQAVRIDDAGVPLVAWTGGYGPPLPFTYGEAVWVRLDEAQATDEAIRVQALMRRYAVSRVRVWSADGGTGYLRAAPASRRPVPVGY